jgi:hypothetical protein
LVRLSETVSGLSMVKKIAYSSVFLQAELNRKLEEIQNLENIKTRAEEDYRRYLDKSCHLEICPVLPLFHREDFCPSCSNFCWSVSRLGQLCEVLSFETHLLSLVDLSKWTVFEVLTTILIKTSVYSRLKNRSALGFTDVLSVYLRSR